LVGFEKSGGRLEGTLLEELIGAPEIPLEEETSNVEGLDDFRTRHHDSVLSLAPGEIDSIYFFIEGREGCPRTHLLGSAGRVDHQQFTGAPTESGLEYGTPDDLSALVDVIGISD